MNFIPCVRWVKRGVAKEKPEKIQLTPQELQSILNETKNEVEPELNELKENNEDVNMEDEYNFENYDKEDEGETSQSVLGIGNVVTFDSKDSKQMPGNGDDADDDSEAEDDNIHSDDNLILVGHVEEDASVLEVYVYNEHQGYMYVHHDILLPTVPLCLEWLSFDPSSSGPGNLVAIGGMSPSIGVWDLDLVDCLEPAFKLGNHTKNKKYRHRNHGHSDAVLDLSWNKHLPHIMASGSVDETVLLWDLETAKLATRFTDFSDKVQSIEWHPTESQTLLTGSSDKNVRVFDCRLENMLNAWEVSGEVEKVAWDPVIQYQALVGTDTGVIHCIDCRNRKCAWQLSAHESEITGIGLDSSKPGLMVTCSMDGLLKTWDISKENPLNLSTKVLTLGELHCLGVNPDNPSLICIGGSKKSNNFTVVDLSSNVPDM